MKRFLAFVLLLALLTLPALAENKEAKSAPAPAGEEMGGEYDEMVLPAIEALKGEWRRIYGEMVDGGMCGPDFTGYLEIKNTRVIRIRKVPYGSRGSAGETNHATETFGDIDYLVDFVIYSDYFGSTPYYEYVGLSDCVAVLRNGTIEVRQKNPLLLYRSRYYESDFSGIIEEIIDLNGAYNAVFHLLEE